MKKTLLLYFIFSLALVAFPPSSVYANHAWGNYHWARTSNPFTIKLGDNLSSSWDPYLATASADWSLSSVLDASIVPGGTVAKRCRATNGRVEVCNALYGNNGWLGLAQIWIANNHITQGVVKLNDTYFNTATYNTPAWRNLVMCQEAGHTFGLDHQDENFSNPPLGTCMDYSNDPASNQHPNQHDYDQLESIYAHLDSITTVGQIVEWKANGEFHNRSEWGRQLKNNGYVAVFERDLGNGKKLHTFVIWSQE